MVQQERAGPSIPISVQDEISGVFQMDRVASIRCYCPSILQRWAARPRHWPSPVIVQKVVSLGACLTPTGFKGSEYKHMEWRICFNTGEAELMNNLNYTQAKVYAMLKMILKNVTEPMLWFSKRRMELEMMWLEMRKSDAQCRDEDECVDMSDAIFVGK
ncbi:hypothetical protein DPMN_040266 [Dreissena polymorpha]|uniref:Mab-21-like nucleotidyltransferase domain-containing protein n=1 Tax=Dreissena polymorpha TaxID=45954 RepID=A0A9D4CWD2_DREPO|nr:hypothetical protein DPMN_040266 [Dreissena polymorpha]